MKLPQDDFPLVVLNVSETGCHPEERSEEGSGLVLAFLGFVILSVSEESDFAFEKSYPGFFGGETALRMTFLLSS